jgi:hypothetical protein
MIGGANKWTAWVKEWAEKNDVTYSCAVSIPECNQEYHAKYGTKPSKKTLERQQARKAVQTGKKQTKAQASLAEMGKTAKAKVAVASAVVEKIKKRRGRPPKVAEPEADFEITPVKRMAPPSTPPPISKAQVEAVKSKISPPEDSKARKAQANRDRMAKLRAERKAQGVSATGKTKTAKKADNISLEVMEIAEPTQSTKQGFSQKTIDEVKSALLARVALAKEIPQVATASPTLVPTAPKGKPRKWKKDELKNNFANWLSWTKGRKVSNIATASLSELTELYEKYNVTPEQVEAEVKAERAKRSGEQAKLEATRDSPESIEYEGQTLVKMSHQVLNDAGIHLSTNMDVYKSADGTFYERNQLKKSINKSSPNNQKTMNSLLNRGKTPAPAPVVKSSGKESRWAEDSDNFGGSNATISKAKDKFGAQWLFGGDDYFYGVKKDGEYYRFKYDEYPAPRKQSEKFYDDAKEWVVEERARRGTPTIGFGIHRHLPDEKDVLWEKYIGGKTGKGYDMEGGAVCEPCLADYDMIIKHLLEHITDPKEPVDGKDFDQAIHFIKRIRKMKGGYFRIGSRSFGKKHGGAYGDDDEGETDHEDNSDDEDGLMGDDIIEEGDENPNFYPAQPYEMPIDPNQAQIDAEADALFGGLMRRMMMRRMRGGAGWEEKPASSGNAFLDTITSVGHDLGKAHPASKYVNPFDAGFKFGEKVVAPALMKTKLGNPKTGIFSKKFWTIKKKHH